METLNQHWYLSSILPTGPMQGSLHSTAWYKLHINLFAWSVIAGSIRVTFFQKSLFEFNLIQAEFFVLSAENELSTTFHGRSLTGLGRQNLPSPFTQNYRSLSLSFTRALSLQIPRFSGIFMCHCKALTLTRLPLETMVCDTAPSIWSKLFSSNIIQI